jgi:4-amino-4-deoxy-L-arabinose transferase-like glycosyltransferase
MQSGSNYLWRTESKLTLAWGVILGLTVVRIVYAGLFPLSADEAYYWQWSRYLDFGYHDHPPMVAWMIWLSTRLLGTHETAVRLPAIVALFGASAYLLELARRWYGEAVALSSVLLTQAMLLFNVGALIVTPDSFQALAWAGALYHVARGYEANQSRHWCLGGLWFGLGMLSKLSMAIFAPLVFIFGLLSPPHRQRLKGWRPYLGLCLGLLLMLPLVIWNLENDWRAFRHLAHQGGVSSAAWLDPRYLGDYLLSQLALLSPLVFFLFLALLVQSRRLWRDAASAWIDRYLWTTAMPVFLLFALLSSHTRVEGNWPAFGYLGASILITARYHQRPIWRWALATAAAISLVVVIETIFPIIPLPSKVDRIAEELSDWRPVGQAIVELAKGMNSGPPFIFAMNYQMASLVAFYTPGQPLTVAINKDKRPNTYDYWWTDEMLAGRDAIGVIAHGDMHEWRLSRFFETADPPQRVTLYDHRRGWNGRRRPLTTLYLYRVCGFKGGHRWEPSSSDDIRTSQPQTAAPPSPGED